MNEEGKMREIEPRYACKTYVNKDNKKPVLLTKKIFDALYEAGMFIDGPFKSTFGDGRYEPYNPHRQAWGKIKTSKESVVYCELHPDMQEKVRAQIGLRE